VLKGSETLEETWSRVHTSPVRFNSFACSRTRRVGSMFDEHRNTRLPEGQHCLSELKRGRRLPKLTNTILSWPHNASSAPWSSPPSLQRSISLALLTLFCRRCLQRKQFKMLQQSPSYDTEALPSGMSTPTGYSRSMRGMHNVVEGWEQVGVESSHRPFSLVCFQPAVVERSRSGETLDFSHRVHWGGRWLHRGGAGGV